MNPSFLFSKSFIVKYALFALLLMLLQLYFAYSMHNVSFGVAIVHSIVSVITLFVLLLGLWFVLRYYQPGSIASFRSMFNTAVAAMVLLLFWYLGINRILKEAFYVHEDYVYFLQNTEVIRGLGGLSVTAIVFLSFYLSIYLQMVNQSIQAQNELKISIQKTELQLLKNQLNPHFIFNSLNSISSLTLYAPDKAREMLVLLSDFLRIALKQDATNTISLEKELQNIELYLKIEKIRFEEKLHWEIKAEKDVLKTEIPALILQPLFENAVKHGIQNCAEKGTLSFEASIKNDYLYLKLCNPFDTKFSRFKGEGVGLNNVKNRLKFIYGQAGLLKVFSKDDVFNCQVMIPLKASN